MRARKRNAVLPRSHRRRQQRRNQRQRTYRDRVAGKLGGAHNIPNGIYFPAGQTTRKSPSTPAQNDASSPVIRWGQTIMADFGVPFSMKGHHFPIPTLSNNTPYLYTVATSLQTAADFAAVFLQRGMLKESDWCGRLTDSITQGLERWVNEDLGGHTVEYLDPSIIYTDNVNQLYFKTEEWQDQARHDDHPDGNCETYGAFALEVGVCELCQLGESIDSLNELEPEAGFCCAGLLQYTLSEFYAFDWHDGLMMIENYYEDYAEPGSEDSPNIESEITDEDEDEDAFPKRADFMAEVPRELLGYKYSMGPIYRCLEKTDDPKTIRLLNDAIALHTISEDAEKAANEMNGYMTLGHGKYSGEHHVPPVGLFYRFNGIEERIFDDSRQGLTQGEHTYFCFVHGFDVRNQTSIHRGCLALGWALRILIAADQMLQGMAADKTRDMRFNTEIRTPLEKAEAHRQRRQLYP